MLHGLLRALMPAILASALAVGCGTRTWTGSLPVIERSPRARELAAYPVDGRAAGVNPPGFCWTPHDEAASYRLEVAPAGSPDRLVLSAANLSSTVFPPSEPLPAGDYIWQVVYVNAEGADYGVSRTRRFHIPDDAPELPMPDVAELERRLAGVRPRLYLAGDRLERIREAVNRGRAPQWDFFIAAADAALEEPLYPEPEGYRGGEFNVPDWRRIYHAGKVGSAHLARLALAYRITGDKKYLDGARRWMLHIASWDPKGIISHDVPQMDGSEGNDEGSMPVLERMAFAWDWIGHELTPKERAKVLAVMAERGNQVLRLLHKQDFLSHPFENHEGRVLAFLGNAGLSFLGDIPEARDWLDYVLRCYLTSFPAWGGDEGGWAQGVGYWGAYVYWLSTFAESLRGVTDTDILRRPFYRNNGYFPLFFHPPYAPMGAFGDGGDGKPSLHEKMLVDYWAEVFQDPVLKWHAASITVPAPPKLTDAGEKRRWNEWFLEDVVSTWRAANPSAVEPQAPDGKPAARFLPNIGWVAMHSALGDAANDVWALFKSSRFGSFSHSHADQNTFQLNAYGEALAIDSGYYPSYGSPHHALWTRQTRAHNGILVNGRGQPPFSWDASGNIEYFEEQAGVMIARGQAAQAYNVPMRPGTLELWRKHLDEPVPSMEPKVESFERTVALLARSTRPFLIVYDRLETASPTVYDWLLHALEPMKLRGSAGAVTIRRGKARCAVRLISTAPLRFSQFGGFPVPPEERAAGSPDQWHLTARTTAPRSEIKFLAVLVPYRAGESEPRITRLEGDRSAGFRIGDVEVAAWWGDGLSGSIAAGRLQGSGRLLIRTAGGETVVSK